MLKYFKPTTPSLRNTVLIDNRNLENKPKLQHLIKGLKKTNGRNNQGRITVRHRGGGHKRSYRQISFDRSNVSGKVHSIEYDPNRSANIAAIVSENNNSFYILAPENLELGQYVESGENVPITLGNSLPLFNIPIGSIIHNIGLKPNQGGQLARSAGTFARLIQKDHKKAIIELSSGQYQSVSIKCLATLGKVSNSMHKNIKIGKAGRSRWLNRRPHVRGVAMNPIDHPHGGGEGKTSGGRPSVSFTGRLTKGKPTRKKSKPLLLKKKK